MTRTEMHAAEPGETGTVREAAEVVQAEVAFPGQPHPAPAASPIPRVRPAALVGCGARHPSPLRISGISDLAVTRLLPGNLAREAGALPHFPETAA